eukprot:comp13404_c0_seq1/m.8898 comp13404_c0_seq1/g.8898  ORF comp13404_c0_seq1/g.8898 comp13404_c0_seq1/m.8898 type:complete len:303 (-) comp13404_c0_seq1:41-949(-)
MPRADLKRRGLYLEYETFGREENPALLLIQGLDGQLTHWPRRLCSMFADSGFYVIIYDNRDVGLSSRFDDLGCPNILANGLRHLLGYRGHCAYTLDDMADDAVALLDHLHISHAHVLGESMGGMIAQLVAIRHPIRLLSLVSVMSTTGNMHLPGPSLYTRLCLIMPQPSTSAELVEYHVDKYRWMHGVAFDEEDSRALWEECIGRWTGNTGGRHLAAILAAQDRTEKLKQLKVKALVIHGKDDCLIPFQCGVATAQAIPGAKLVLIDRMGHGWPRAFWGDIVKEVSALKEHPLAPALAAGNQ